MTLKNKLHDKTCSVFTLDSVLFLAMNYAGDFRMKMLILGLKVWFEILSEAIEGYNDVTYNSFFVLIKFAQLTMEVVADKNEAIKKSKAKYRIVQVLLLRVNLNISYKPCSVWYDRRGFVLSNYSVICYCQFYSQCINRINYTYSFTYTSLHGVCGFRFCKITRLCSFVQWYYRCANWCSRIWAIVSKVLGYAEDIASSVVMEKITRKNNISTLM